MGAINALAVPMPVFDPADHPSIPDSFNGGGEGVVGVEGVHERRAGRNLEVHQRELH